MRWAQWKLVLLLPLMAGCASGFLTAQKTESRTFGSDGRDTQQIAKCSVRMERCLDSIQRLRLGSRRHSDLLLPRDHDVLEQSLAEYLACRNELEQIAAREQKQDVELSRVSQRCQTQSDLQLVSLALEDEVLGRALNQSFHRSGISRGSCDRLLHEVTSARVELDADYQELHSALIRRRAMLWPEVENELRHARPVELLAESTQTISTQLQHGRHVLTTTVGRLKNPTARPLKFTDVQRQEIRSALQPGDVLLTYTAGLASNFVVPGNLKHAAVFVGTEDERRRAGLPSEKLLAIAGPNNQPLARALSQTTIDGGQAADLVESLAEGVLLNNFDRLLTSRVNLLVAIRPRLDDRDRAQQVADVLSYVGDEFDFSFDLTEASDQVCTELVYRSLHGRGGIDLPLSKHAGRLTLTADEIATYAMQRGSHRFTCVLAVIEASEASGNAKVLNGSEAQQYLARLLGIGS